MCSLGYYDLGKRLASTVGTLLINKAVVKEKRKNILNARTMGFPGLCIRHVDNQNKYTH